jgi:hypothetical protein
MLASRRRLIQSGWKRLSLLLIATSTSGLSSAMAASVANFKRFFDFRILPVGIEAMYAPDIHGKGIPQQMRVQP